MIYKIIAYTIYIGDVEIHNFFFSNEIRKYINENKSKFQTDVYSILTYINNISWILDDYKICREKYFTRGSSSLDKNKMIINCNSMKVIFDRLFRNTNNDDLIEDKILYVLQLSIYLR